MPTTRRCCRLRRHGSTTPTRLWRRPHPGRYSGWGGAPADRLRRLKGGGRVSGLAKRSFSLAGHRTSVALEDEFWAALIAIAAERGKPVSALVTEVDAQRADGQTLASALRVIALKHYAPPRAD